LFFVARRSVSGGESGAVWSCRCSRPAGRDIQHAKRPAFLVGTITLSERTI